MWIPRQVATISRTLLSGKRARAALFFLLCSTFSPSAFAADVLVPVATDSRIKTFVYSDNDVYNIVTHYGYQSNIEFGNQEEVETISVGDRVPFQIVPAGRRLFIRAMTANARTNMTVVTNKHAYQFDLMSVPTPVLPNEELVYVIRFFYPGDKKNQMVMYPNDVRSNTQLTAGAPSGNPYNYKYTFSGSNEVAPVKVFDDGKSTFFKFRARNQGDYSSYNPMPNIFTIDENAKETFVPSHNDGEYWVVNMIAPRFKILDGEFTVWVYNEKLDHN